HGVRLTGHNQGWALHAPKLRAVIEGDALAIRALEKRQHILALDHSLGRVRIKRAAGIKRAADAPEFVIRFGAAVIEGAAHHFACINSSEPLEGFQYSLTPDGVAGAAQRSAY